MTNNKFSKNNLKRLVSFVYNESDKCYHLISNVIIDMCPHTIKEINDDFTRRNKLFNNDFAYSILDIKDTPLREIYTGMRLRDRIRQPQRLNYNPSLRC